MAFLKRSLRLGWPLGLMAIALPLLSQERSAGSVKAAYLVKFCEYVQWPPQVFPLPETPFVLGIQGEDPFGPELDDLARTQTIQGRRIKVRRFRWDEPVREVHLLYVHGDLAQAGAALRAVRDLPVLTVGEGGGVNEPLIRFRMEDRKVRFTINPEGAHRSSLRISATLLNLGRPRPPEGGTR